MAWCRPSVCREKAQRLGAALLLQGRAAVCRQPPAHRRTLRCSGRRTGVASWMASCHPGVHAEQSLRAEQDTFGGACRKGQAKGARAKMGLTDIGHQGARHPGPKVHLKLRAACSSRNCPQTAGICTLDPRKGHVVPAPLRGLLCWDRQAGDSRSSETRSIVLRGRCRCARARRTVPPSVAPPPIVGPAGRQSLPCDATRPFSQLPHRAGVLLSHWSY